MDIATDAYVNLLIQVPLVGIFVWFAHKQTQLFIEAQEKRDASWREFFKNQQDAVNAALGRLAEEIKTNGEKIAELRGEKKNA